MRTRRIILCWPADIRTARALVMAASLALLLSAGGHAASAAPGKDPRETQPLARSHAQEPLAESRAISPAAPHSKAAAVVARPEPEWRTGIVASGQAPLPGALYRIENQWHEVIQGRHVNVYAGALAQRPSEGVFVVQTTDLQPGARSGMPEVVRAPAGAGPLHLESAHGSTLRIVSAQGRRFTFDVASRELRQE
jgi:hypothetical protein